MLRHALEGPSVSDDPAFNASDACVTDELFPLSECLFERYGDRVLRAEGRVCTADNVDVSMEHAVADCAVMSDRCLEPVVASEDMQGCACRNELHV